jgi:hypothetical protein
VLEKFFLICFFRFAFFVSHHYMLCTVSPSSTIYVRKEVGTKWLCIVDFEGSNCYSLVAGIGRVFEY